MSSSRKHTRAFVCCIRAVFPFPLSGCSISQIDGKIRNPSGLFSLLVLGTGLEAVYKTAISQATTHKECFVKLERARELPLELMDAVQPL